MSAQRAYTNEWDNWIAESSDMDPNQRFKVLHDAGFEYEGIVEKLGYAPDVDLDWVENPLEAAAMDAALISTQLTRGTSEPIEIDGGHKVLDDRVEMWVLDDFMNAKECEAMIEVIKDGMRPSKVTMQGADYWRTSSTNDVIADKSDFAMKINHRIAHITGLDNQHSERMQGQHYEEGEVFKEHNDYFSGEMQMHKYGGRKGQRSYTVMVYLNNVEEGGETVFPHLGITSVPKMGRAIIWNNLNLDGTVNPITLHESKPVIKGTKTVITKWFRTAFGLPVFKRDLEYVPNYTDIGFKKEILPVDLFERLKDFLHGNQDLEMFEGDNRFIVNEDNGEPTTIIPIFDEGTAKDLQEDIHNRILPMLEEWSGEALDKTILYGLRNYKRGTQLDIHKDRSNGHTISAIINVYQDVDEDWPLSIEDNYGKLHELNIKPGEMIFYEGRNLLHGRLTPFKGNSFVNAFAHYIPKSLK